MERDRRKSSDYSIAMLVIGFLMLLSLYVVSSGPALYLTGIDRMSGHTWDAVYRPLYRLDHQGDIQPIYWRFNRYWIWWWKKSWQPQPATAPLKRNATP
jgi:hypothetical protein